MRFSPTVGMMYRSGDIGNQAVRKMDVARWGLDVGFPNEVSAIGAHFMFDDDQETPNTLTASFEFNLPDGKRKMLVFEVHHWMTNTEAGIGMPGFGAGAQAIPGAAGESARQQPKAMCGNLNYGSKGYVAMSGYDTYRSWLGESQERGPTATCGENRWANFLDCVRTHAPEKV